MPCAEERDSGERPAPGCAFAMASQTARANDPTSQLARNFLPFAERRARKLESCASFSIAAVTSAGLLTFTVNPVWYRSTQYPTIPSLHAIAGRPVTAACIVTPLIPR